MQSILDGPLEFCKQDAKHIDKDSRVALADVIDPSPQLLSAIEELLEKILIKRDGRNLSVHRVVQEATTYGDLIDLQTCALPIPEDRNGWILVFKVEHLSGVYSSRCQSE
jgi:hypothetical protein